MGEQDEERMRAPLRVCRRCGRVLDYQDNVGYQHSLADRNADHEAEPVSPDDAITLGRCDICFADLPDWVVPVRDFEVVPGHHSGGDWAACNVCVKLIERNQWSALWRRAKESWESRHGPMPEPVEQGLARMYRMLRKNITGAPQPNPYRLAGSHLDELGLSGDEVSGEFGRGYKARHGDDSPSA